MWNLRTSWSRLRKGKNADHRHIRAIYKEALLIYGVVFDLSSEIKHFERAVSA